MKWGKPPFVSIGCLTVAALGAAAQSVSARTNPSSEAILACSNKAAEAQSAYHADDLDAYLRLSKQTEALCAYLDDPSLRSSYSQRRGDLLMSVRHDYAGAKIEYEQCIARYYNAQFCHFGLVTALLALGDEFGAKAANQRTIKVLQSLIDQHDLQAAIFIKKFPAAAEDVAKERAMLVELKTTSEHRFDPIDLDKLLHQPSKH